MRQTIRGFFSGNPPAQGKRSQFAPRPFAAQVPRASPVLQRKPGQQPEISADVAAPSGKGKEMPESVRGKMETAFDADFSSVGIHEGEHASAIGALAFTQGESIHFAPGRYDPSSTSGQSLLGHELAHVVQQRSGRVSSLQGKGTTVNANPVLESEADRAGERAARGESVRDHWTSDDAQEKSDSDAEMPIQCNLGIEVEINNEWFVHWAESKSPATEGKSNNNNNNNQMEGRLTSGRQSLDEKVSKGTTIVIGKGFELQAEDSGENSTIEFVTSPPGMASRTEVEQVMDSMTLLAGKLKEKAIKDKRFNAGSIGGDQRLELTCGFSLAGSMQATVGVPLACVPMLYTLLASSGVEDKETMQAAVDSAKTSLAKINPITKLEPSGEVVGFLTLLRHYLAQGSDIKENDRSFPKAVFKMMARTDFKEMFWMLPESDALVGNLEQWIALVLGGLKEDEPVLRQTFNYDARKQKAPYKIATTRREWLQDMPNFDRLSVHGKKAESDVHIAQGYKPPERDSSGIPRGSGEVQAWRAPNTEQVKQLASDIESLYEGIGSYGGMTDAVRYDNEKEDTKAVLIEIRHPPTKGGAPDKWKDSAIAIFDAMVRAIATPHGSKEQKKFILVDTKEQETKRAAAVEKYATALKTAHELKDSAAKSKGFRNKVAEKLKTIAGRAGKEEK